MLSQHSTDDQRIVGIKEVVSPELVHAEHPVSAQAEQVILEARQDIHRIIHGDDDRLLVVVGPCSIHHPDEALIYAKRLRAIKATYGDTLKLVMRVYFEKPRTTVGWKGLINDPHLDDSFEINQGIRIARKLLLEINHMGVPAGTEFLDLITPQYFADLVSWGAIGARTTESQGHRELSSGLSCPIGFKNSTEGGFRIAIDAIQAAAKPHHFLSLTKEGRSAIFTTSGNEDCHIILRGGKAPNYGAKDVADVMTQLAAAKVQAGVMIDFSHANSLKQHERQMIVGEDVCQQMSQGNRKIMGVMIESHLHAGRQNVVKGEPLKPGVSITDACLGWNDTVTLLDQLSSAVKQRREVS
ncbi:MAG: 3-deoxy-7-phosphoheptulonate synthase, partial [Mariprofundaceae bacterium]|nr:3-deoxy-7-phosphoheptulonate synthase [Mariprofundaceae bacterium]